MIETPNLPEADDAAALGRPVQRRVARLYVRENERARRLGLADEVEVGWVIECANGEDYHSHPWGSCRDEAALASLIADTRAKQREAGADLEIHDLRQAA